MGAAELNVGVAEAAHVLARCATSPRGDGAASGVGADGQAAPSLSLALEAAAAFACVPKDVSAGKALAIAAEVYLILAESTQAAREEESLHASRGWQQAVRTVGAAMVCGALDRERRSALHACWQRLIAMSPRGSARAAALEALCVCDAAGARALPPPAAALALKRLKDEACAEWVIARGASAGEDSSNLAAVDAALCRAVGDALLPARGGVPVLPHDLDIVLGALNALRFALVRVDDERRFLWDAESATSWLRAARAALDGAQAVAAASADSSDPDDVATARAATGASALQEALTAAEEALDRRR